MSWVPRPRMQTATIARVSINDRAARALKIHRRIVEWYRGGKRCPRLGVIRLTQARMNSTIHPDQRMNRPRNLMAQQPAALMGWMEALADPLRLRLLRV